MSLNLLLLTVVSGENKYNARDVIISGAAGFVGANIGGMINKASKLGKIGKEVISSASDTVVGAASEYAKKGEVDLEKLSLTTGAGKLGEKALGKLAKSAAGKSDTSKAYDTAISRAERMNSPTKKNGSPRDIGRPNARQEKLDSITQGKADFLDAQEFKGGLVGAGVGGSSVEIYRNSTQSQQDGKQ